jgi:hypothetical protein
LLSKYFLCLLQQIFLFAKGKVSLLFHKRWGIRFVNGLKPKKNCQQKKEWVMIVAVGEREFVSEREKEIK